MKATILKAKKRKETGKKARAKAGNNIPAVIYGNDIKSENLWVNANDFEKMFVTAGTNTVIELTINDNESVNALVYDYQLDPISDKFIHIDFYIVNMKEEVEAEIPLVFTGVSAAVKELGGTLVKNNDSLVVKALPADLPHEIEVDLSPLVTFDDNISVSDIIVGDKIELMLDKNATVVSVSAPRSEEEMAELDSEINADVSNIEGVADKVEDGEENTNEDDDKKEEEKPEEK